MQSGSKETKPDSSLGWGHLPHIATAPETGAASGWGGWHLCQWRKRWGGGVSPRGGADRTGGQPRARRGGERARASADHLWRPVPRPWNRADAQRGSSRGSGFCGVAARVRGSSRLLLQGPGVLGTAARRTSLCCLPCPCVSAPESGGSLGLGGEWRARSGLIEGHRDRGGKSVGQKQRESRRGVPSPYLR